DEGRKAMNDQPKRLYRSWMLVPGDRQRMIDKSLGTGVDAIMIDIEDGLDPQEKENARAQIAGALDVVADRLRDEPKYRTPGRFVRTNAGGAERFIQDIKAVVRHGLEGLVISKVDTVAQVRVAEDELGRAEVSRHMAGGSVKFLLAIESPIGLFNAYQIASSSPRVIGMLFGAEDFAREMKLPMRREGGAG